jgi:hypothetical protein
MSASAIIHAVGTPEKALCGVKASDSNTTNAKKVSCQRCLKKLEAIKVAAKEAAAAAKAAAKPAKKVNLHSIGETKNGTACNVAGKTTEDPDAVTCGICRAKLDGTKPANAISDEVKVARKHFKSFVARIAYMAYMDAPASTDPIDTIAWSLEYTNSAGIVLTANGIGNVVVLTDSEGAETTVRGKDAVKDSVDELCWVA